MDPQQFSCIKIAFPELTLTQENYGQRRYATNVLYITSPEATVALLCQPLALQFHTG
jgi:hypothetical protein